MSEILYRRFFELAKDGALILDGTTGAIQDANPFFLELLGYTREELLGKQLWDLGFTQDEAVSRAAFHDLQEQEYIRYENLPLITKSGRPIEVEFISNVYFAGGKKLIQGIVRDISERKQTERRLKSVLESLERSNRELEAFAYVASHDLQEPLRKIQAFGDCLKSECAEELSQDGRYYVDRMQSAASRMQTLINDLLAFSRVTSQPSQFVPVDLAVVLPEVLLDLEHAVREGGVQIDSHLSPDMPVLQANPLQIRQLLQNLIHNAIKFRRTEVTSRVTVSVERVGERCRIRVEDNGIGFEAKYQEKIFGIFRRLHGREEYAGTGIGLAICRRIAERHGGSITAVGQPGKGATFTVDLPLRPEAMLETYARV